MSSQISNNECLGLTPFSASRKRKDRDRPDAHEAHVTTKGEPPAPADHLAPPQHPAGAGGNNILAGYLAHEFLTRGTLFGERWDPASRPPPSQAKEPVAQRQNQNQNQKQPTPPALAQAEAGKPPRAYTEVAHLLKTDRAHVPGVVNPTQLAQWLQM